MSWWRFWQKKKESKPVATEFHDELVSILLDAPDSQLDKAMKPYIRKWSNPPKTVEVLEVLDYCINGSLASGTAILALQTLYEVRCKAENTTHEEVAKHATWRTA